MQIAAVEGRQYLTIVAGDTYFAVDEFEEDLSHRASSVILRDIETGLTYYFLTWARRPVKAIPEWLQL